MVFNKKILSIVSHIRFGRRGGDRNHAVTYDFVRVCALRTYCLHRILHIMCTAVSTYEYIAHVRRRAHGWGRLKIFVRVRE